MTGWSCMKIPTNRLPMMHRSHYAPAVPGVPDTIRIEPGTVIPSSGIFSLSHAEVENFVRGRTVLTDDGMDDPVTDEPREIEEGDFVIAMCQDCIWEIVDSPYLPKHAYVEPAQGITVESTGPWEWLNMAAGLMWFGRYRSDPPALEPAADGSIVTILVSDAITELGAGTPGVEPFDPSRWQLPSNPTEASVRIARSGYFQGLWSVCSCGRWDDTSAFLDIWGHVPIVSLVISSGSPFEITLLPRRR